MTIRSTPDVHISGGNPPTAPPNSIVERTGPGRPTAHRGCSSRTLTASPSCDPATAAADDGRPRFAEAGFLMSYGTAGGEVLRLTAVFVDKIPRGAKPADLPVEQPSRLELVVNLATAKTLDFNTRERSCCRQTT
jgi:hypothetical protein